MYEKITTLSLTNENKKLDVGSQTIADYSTYKECREKVKVAFDLAVNKEIDNTIRRKSCFDSIYALNVASLFNKELNTFFGMTAMRYKTLASLVDDEKEGQIEHQKLTLFE